MTSWTMLHYSHTCGWKLSDITFDWLVYCSGLNFSKWSWQLCLCKYLICVMYLSHYLWIMCVYSKCVSKWSTQWTCDNSVTWYWRSLGWGTLHCVVCNEHSASLVERASALQCIPLHHETSGYEGVISDILTVCLFLISLPFTSIEMILQGTIHLLCWWNV